MVLDNIEKLLEKYDNGETTLLEEQQLKHYFTEETVPPHLDGYKAMFQYFSVTKEEQFTKDVPLKTKTNNLYKWISVAAVVAIMFGVYINQPTSISSMEDLSPEQQLAYNQTVEGLQYLGIAFNKGNEKMKSLDLVASNLNEGTKKMTYLGEFSKTTNKILKTNN